MKAPFDPGLQPERTALAWRRTCLALLAGSLVAARILPEFFGPWSALLGVVGAAAAAALLAAVHRRYSSHHRALHQYGDRVALADGRLVASLAVFATAAAGISLAAVLARTALG